MYLRSTVGGVSYFCRQRAAQGVLGVNATEAPPAVLSHADDNVCEIVLLDLLRVLQTQWYGCSEKDSKSLVFAVRLSLCSDYTAMRHLEVFESEH